MRVWIENPFDNLPAEGYRAQRYSLMAEAFAKAGHEVTLWTSDFNHTTKARRVFQTASPLNYSLKLIPTLAYHKNISLRRLLSHALYATRWFFTSLKSPKPELLIVSAPPLLTGLYALFYKLRGTSVIVDIMDAWPETFERVAPRAILWPLRILSRFIYAKADKLMGVADAYARLSKREYKRFYHGIHLRSPKELTENAATKRSLKLLYLGNLGKSYDLTTVIKALKYLPYAKLSIAGAGEQEIKLKELSKNVAVSFHGYLQKGSLTRLMNQCDIGIVPLAPESCVGVPYKFADYAERSLAIVSSLGGESSMLLAKYQAGATYRQGDEKSLAEAIDLIATRLEACRLASRKLAEEEFDADKIYDEIVKFSTLS